jgi:phage gp29-like protein
MEGQPLVASVTASKIKRVSGVFKRGDGPAAMVAALQASTAPLRANSAPSPDELLSDRLEVEAEAAMAAVMAQIEAMVASAGSLPELREMLLAAYPDVDASQLAGIMALAMISAWGGGAEAAAGDSDDA